MWTKLHRASIVYEFEQYRQKTVEYRAKYGLKFGCRSVDRRFMDLLILCAFHSTAIRGLSLSIRKAPTVELANFRFRRTVLA